MSLCWEVWGAEEGGRVWALMKLPPPQLLAALAAVSTAVFLGAPRKPNSGALPGWPVQTELVGSQAGQREVKPGLSDGSGQ